MAYNYLLRFNTALVTLFSLMCSIVHAQTWQWASTQTTNSQGISAISKVLPDGAGNTVVVGGFRGVVAFGANVALTSNSSIPFGGPGDVFVGRLNSSGVWTQVAQVAGLGSESVNFVEVDAAGTITIAGTFDGPELTLGTIKLTNTNSNITNPTADVFMARLNSAGTWTQAINLPSSSFGNDGIRALSVDASGTATVVGNSDILAPSVGSLLRANMFIGRWNSSGVYIPVIQSTTNQTAYVYAAKVDATGTITLAGTFTSSSLTLGTTTVINVSGRDLFAARITSAGTCTWATKASGIVSNMYGVSISALAINAAGAVTITGNFDSPTLNFGTISLANSDPTGLTTNLFVASLNNNGTWTQAVRAGGNTNSAGELILNQFLALDADGTATLVGYFVTPTATFGNIKLINAGSGATAVSNDIFVARLNSSGVWTQAVRAGGSNNDGVAAFLIDDAGNVTVSGGFQSAVCNFGAIAFTNTGPTTTSDIFIAQLSNAGVWTQAISLGGKGSEAASALAIDATGAFTIGGSYTSLPLSFGTTTLTLSPLSSTQAFVAKLSSLPPANDAAVLAVYAQGKVITGGLQVVQATVRNTGSQTLTNYPVTLTVAGATVFTDTKTVASLPASTSAIVTFTAYAANTTGANVITVNVSSDDVNTNNSQSYNQQVQASTYAVADPTQGATAGGVGYPAAGGIFAVRYTASTASVITAINARLEGAPLSIGRTVYAVVLSNVGTIIARTPDYIIQSSDIGTYKRFSLATPVSVAVGDFYIGLAQAAVPAGTAQFYPLGVQTEVPTRPGSFYTVALAGGFPDDLAAYNLGRFMIEAVNNQVLSLSTTNALNQAIQLFPNPSSGQTTLDIHGANAAGAMQLALFNVLGQEVYTSTVRDNFQNRLDLSNLPNGLYLLHVKSGSDYFVRQLVLTK
jgi:hypothetical protein